VSGGGAEGALGAGECVADMERTVFLLLGAVRAQCNTGMQPKPLIADVVLGGAGAGDEMAVGTG
jgi:hypothetical protein